jgi:hypothetical protein
MAPKFKLNWAPLAVRRMVNRRAQQGVEAIAYRVRDKARRNLEANGQIDTKFLYNSIYVSTPNGTSPLPPSGEYRSLKGHGIVRRNTGAVAEVDEGAFVGAAADYAIYPEMDQPYLYPALEEVAGREAEMLLSALYARDVDR